MTKNHQQLEMGITLPETNSEFTPENRGSLEVWRFLLGFPPFVGATSMFVSFRECTFKHSKIGSLSEIHAAKQKFMQPNRNSCSQTGQSLRADTESPCYDEEKSKVQRKETADANLHLASGGAIFHRKEWIFVGNIRTTFGPKKLKDLETTQKNAATNIGILLFGFNNVHQSILDLANPNFIDLSLK